MTVQEAVEVLEVFTTEKFQCLTSSEFDDAICCAITALEKQGAVKKVIERLEATMKERIITAHHTSDVFVDGQANGLECAIEILKEEVMKL